MWILAEWLKEYEPETLIKNGERILTNVRLFTDGLHTEPSCVYIGTMKDFIDSESDRVICVSGQDMILLNTNDINSTFNSILAAFDWHNSWSEDLKRKTFAGISLDQFLNEAYKIFKSPVLIADPGFAVKARAGTVEEYSDNMNIDSVLKNGTMLLDTLIKLNKDSRLRQRLSDAYYYNSEQQGFPTLIKNIFIGNTHVGWLVMITKTDPPETYIRHMFEELGEIAQLWACLNPDERSLLSFDDIFPRMLSGEKITAGDLTYFSLLGWKEEDEKFLYIIKGRDNENNFSQIRSRLDNYLHAGAVTVYENNPVIIINTALLCAADAQGYLKDFMEQTDSFCVKGPGFTDYHQIPGIFRVCRKMLELSGKERAMIYKYEDLAGAYAACLVRENSAADLVNPALYALKAYDAQNKTDFYETLKVYLICERNLVKTASRLFIHRNSLVYRIRRICEITGLDLDDEQVRMHVLMSYYLDAGQSSILDF